MHHVETYPFVEYQYSNGVVRYRTELPVRLLNPETGAFVDSFALLDTGADACLFDRVTTVQAGHALKGDGVTGSVTGGVGGEATTYKHTIDLQLFSGKGDRIVWKSGARLFDCIDAEIPPLLGVRDFPAVFRVEIDYPKKAIRLEWEQ